MGVKEMGDILGALRGSKESAILVTVVAVEGSTYRRPGARMLVAPGLPAGRVGSISGGCLEDEACRRAMFLADKGPSVVTYETGLDDGPGPGYTLGCGGRVTSMFERVGPGLTPEYLAFIDRHRAAGRSCVVVTVIATEGEPPLHVGDRALLFAEGTVEAIGANDAVLRAEAAAALESECSRHTMLEFPGGRAQALIEVIPAPVHLLIFGTGHDSDPVATLAANLGWRITVIAPKPSDAVKHRFAVVADVIALADAPRRLAEPLARRSAAIVMNHNYAHDSEAIGVLLGSSAAYIGILGPRHRTDAMLSDVASTQRFDAAGIAARIDLSRVHAPIGLDIGAETAEEVALAIISEVQAYFADRDGGRLRDRPGAIHPPVQGKVSAPIVEAACPLDAAP